MAEKRVSGGAPWRGKRSQGAVLIGLCQSAELWHDMVGVAFATIQGPRGPVHLEVSSVAFRQWLARGYYDECGGAPSGAALADTVAYVAAKAIFGGGARDVFLRIGSRPGEIIVDTCDQQSSVVRISTAGVTVEHGSSIPFRRPPSAGTLPEPAQGVQFGALREFINVSDDDWPLVAGWLVAALRPDGPFPVLFLHGEQGSGKSTQARVLRALVDPNFAPLRAAPRDVQDLAVSAHNNWVIALDNLSYLPVWLSDALCRLSTGGGFATRVLYANDREAVFHAQRPVLITGIEDLATRGDLIDRAIIVHLPVISKAHRRPERELREAFEVARPALFGALCDAVATGLRNEGQISIEGLPRLADFASWAAAASTAFSSTPAEFMALYERGVAEHSVAAVEASALARPIIRLALAGDWLGTTSDLLYAVETLAGRAGIRSCGWPRSLPQFAGCVRRLAPDLRAIGVSVTFKREPPSGRRVIQLSVENAEAWAGLSMQQGSLQPVQLGLIDPLG